MSRFYNTQILSDNGSNGGNDNSFGANVAAHGNYLAVSDPNNHSGGEGAVIVYVLKDGKYNYLQTLKDDRDEAADNSFGDSVAMHGNYLVVGDNSNQTTSKGAVYVYVLKSGIFEFSQKIVNHRTDQNDFGDVVSIFGNYLAVSDGNNGGASTDSDVFIYVLRQSKFEFLQMIPLRLDKDPPVDTEVVSLSQYGNFLAIGDRDGSDHPTRPHGTVHIYKLMEGKYNFLQTLKDDESRTDAGNLFGQSVYLYKNYLIVGDTNNGRGTGSTTSGTAYIYLLKNGKYENIRFLKSGIDINDAYGWRVFMNGNYLAVSSFDTDGPNPEQPGEVYIYILNHGVPVFLQKLIAEPPPAVGNEFGMSLFLTGNYLFVGDQPSAINLGKVYVYRLQRNEPDSIIITDGTN